MYVELYHGQLKLFFFLLSIGMIVLHTDWLLIRFELMFFHSKTLCVSVPFADLVAGLLLL